MERPRAALQEVMLRILEILAADGELREQLGRIHEALWSVMDASNLYVALYDEGSGLYVFPYNADPDDQDFAPQALRKSLTDYVRRRGEALLCRESDMDRLVEKGEIERIGLPSPVWLGAPLLTPRGSIGAVVVQHYADPVAMTEADVPTLAAIGRCMGVAVERAWLEERRRAEHELRLRELTSSRDEAVRASQAKSAFLQNMSHELRTPLNAILGYADLLLEERADADPRLREDLEAIRGAATHLRELIDGVLDLTQVESGHYELVPTTFALRDVIDAVASQVGPLLARGRNQLARSGDDAVGTLHTDRRALLQILAHLAGNAGKFTEDGRVAVRSRRRGAAVEIEVSDTGVGFDPARLREVFAPFTQLDASSTRVRGGSGLGLTIASRLAAALGGRIDAASVPGRGSTFTLVIPADLPAR